MCVCGGGVWPCQVTPPRLARGSAARGEGGGGAREGWRGGGSLTGRRPEQRLSRDHVVRERESCSLCSWPRSRK